MSLVPHEFIFRGDLAALGPFHSQVFVDALCAGEIVSYYVEAEGVSGFSGDWYIGLTKNGADILTGAERPQITAIDLEVEVTGLSEAVAFRDRLVPTVDARGAGTITGPITVIIWVRPTEKTTPVDADTVAIADSAASNVTKRLSWANIKATLKTYLDTLYVALSGAQTIAGVKTFSSSPIVPTPAGATDAANKGYVDASIAGLSWKQAVRAATTTTGTLASSFESGDTIDGVVLATGDRILLKDQTTGSENGIYTVNASGAPTRATDADAGGELVNASVYVSEGTANADKQFVCTTNAPITVGSTALTFTEFSSGGGDVASDAIWAAKGDLAVGTGADTASVLSVGTNGQVLSADSAEATGLKWIAAGGVSDGDKGDITVSASGATWTVDNDVVTYAKMQNVSATSRILGRKTAAAGDAEECTLSEILDFIGSAAQGDILYRDSTGWARLPAGTSGNFLKTQGAAANPAWAAVPGGGDLLASNNLSDVANAGTARTNLGLKFNPASASGAASQEFHEDTDNGTNKVTLAGPATIASDKTQTLQDRTGTVALTDGFGTPIEIGAACSDETTALATGTAKVTFRTPCAITVTGVRASLATAQTSGSIFTVDINEGGTSILSTKLTIDNTERTSTTATTAAVISDSALADDAEITVDIDQVGDGTAKGLKIWLIGTRA